MKIAISGSHGFIARHLEEALLKENHQIIPISRDLLLPKKSEFLIQALDSCDAIINLAGASIDQRWTKRNKRIILKSRILSTRALVNAVNQLTVKPKVFVSASAVGAYPFGAVCDESNTTYGDHFLARVCREWEYEANQLTPEVRLVIPRLGVVLASDGGAFQKMILPFKLHLGGRIGSGWQGLSWIHVNDLVNSLIFILKNENAQGVINLTSPQKTNNLLFTLTFCKITKKIPWLTLPEQFLRFILGEQAELVTKGQQVYPIKLLNLGFTFRFPTLAIAIRQIVKE